MGLIKQLFTESKTLALSLRNVWRNRAAISQLSFEDMMKNSMNNYKQHLEEKSKILTTCGTIGVTYALGEIIAQSINKNYDFSRVATFWLYGTALGGPCYYAWFSYLDKLPGKMVVESNKYQNLFFERLPKILEKHTSIQTNSKLILNAYTCTDKKIGSEILPSNSAIQVYIPEKSEIAVSSVKFQPREIEGINKWTIKLSKILADQLIFSSSYTLFLIFATGLMTGKDLVSIASTIQSSFWKIYLLDCLIWPPLQFVNFTFVKKEFQPIYVNVLNVFWNTFLSLCLAAPH